MMINHLYMYVSLQFNILKLQSKQDNHKYSNKKKLPID